MMMEIGGKLSCLKERGKRSALNKESVMLRTEFYSSVHRKTGSIFISSAFATAVIREALLL
jgi:hypothetical protein